LVFLFPVERGRRTRPDEPASVFDFLLLEQLVSEPCGSVTAAAAPLLAVHRLSEPSPPPAIAGWALGNLEASREFTIACEISSCLSLDGMA
jgi:hypothetical protein